jgi:hypothetical protein
MFKSGAPTMAATLRIDTLKFVRRLTGAGMERQMAEAIADGLAEADTSDLATKADLAALDTSLRAEIAGLRTDLAGVRAELKTDIADAKAEVFRVMMVQGVAIVGLVVTLMKLLP